MAFTYYPPTENGIQKTLTAALDVGVTSSATFNNVTGIQNKKGIFVVDRVDANGQLTPSKREYISFTGTSGSNVVTLTRGLAGSTDQDHSIGAIVEFVPDVVMFQAFIDLLAVTVDVDSGTINTNTFVTPTDIQTISGKTLAGVNIVLGSDATGDMYYRGAGASLSRLAKGTSGQYLAMNDTLPYWKTLSVETANTQWVTIANASLMTIDFSLGNKFQATVVPAAGPATFGVSNASLSCIGMLRVVYASTASFSLNLLTVNATTSWPGGSAPTPTATIGKADVFGFSCISTLPKFDGFIIGQNI